MRKCTHTHTRTTSTTRERSFPGDGAVRTDRADCDRQFCVCARVFGCATCGGCGVGAMNITLVHATPRTVIMCIYIYIFRTFYDDISAVCDRVHRHTVRTPRTHTKRERERTDTKAEKNRSAKLRRTLERRAVEPCGTESREQESQVRVCVCAHEIALDHHVLYLYVDRPRSFVCTVKTQYFGNKTRYTSYFIANLSSTESNDPDIVAAFPSDLIESKGQEVLRIIMAKKGRPNPDVQRDYLVFC